MKKEELKDDSFNDQTGKLDRVRELRSKNKVGKRIRVQFDIDYSGSLGKTMDGKSQTIPDLNLTVTQLIQNHVRGASGNVQAYEPLYFETEIPTINDITDVDRYRQELQERLNQVNEFIKNEKILRDEEERKKAVQKAKKGDLSDVASKNGGSSDDETK